MAELTPMKKQYNKIKQEHQDCLLFFRLGDFYEMFDDDAKVASKELDLALTTRDRGKPKEEQTPMCGIPFHSAETYIAKLISKGYKVAICEQLEDPNLVKGLVERGVIRIITPGTVTESSMLEESCSNYIASVFADDISGGIAFCDISTGEFCTTSFSGKSDMVDGHLINELTRFSPSEVLVSPETAKRTEILEFIRDKLGAMTEEDENWFVPETAKASVAEQFPEDRAALNGQPAAETASGALLYYLKQTQKFDLSHIDQLNIYSEKLYMEMDWTTRRNLELTESLRTGEKKGSLLWVLDRTQTPMGGRMLRSWLERPLLSPVPIKRRLSAVEEISKAMVKRGELTATLREITDMERLIGRIVYGTANGKDLVALANCAAQIPALTDQLKDARSPLLREIGEMDRLEDIRQIVEEAIDENPPFSVREGGILRKGYSEEIDRLREIRDNGARMVAELEEREREKTGCKKLKVGYNKVFGYYIDVPNSANLTEPPEGYIRKQTLVSNERYFTQELKDLESSLLTARDRIADLEYQYFEQIRLQIAAEVNRIKATATSVATLDVICSLAEVAVRNGYTMPEVDNSREIRIAEGRHPVVECTMKDTLFVPNDAVLNLSDDRVAIITGPNMAGKSTYMRQTALIVLLAQIGSFVPAKSATIGVVDRIFTRIGASDDLASGQSTFMVEMNEMAYILKHATADSLLIIDEIGRGTSTFDGMAIARAVLEYCADKRRLGAKTMFATHYHELSALENSISGVKNYNITAKKQKGTLVFLRKIVRGSADDSYGIEVAKLAGIPDSVIAQARTYLEELESEEGKAPVVKEAASTEETDQISFYDLGADEIRETLRQLDLNTITPLEAMNLLYQLQKKVKEQ